MNYIDELAQAIRQFVPSDLIPPGDTASLFRLYAVLAMAKGERVVAEDVHDAWAAWMSERDAQHSSLRPFRDLPEQARLADEPYVNAIRAVAHHRQLGR